MRTLPNFLVVVLALLVSHPAGAADDAGGSDAEILGFADAAVLGQARGGDAVAQFLIAKAFSYVRADAEKSIYWARLAADQGLSMAQAHLGKFYEMGVGVERDYARAAGLFRKAADQGDPVGALRLAGLHLASYGVPQDDAMAPALFRQAADQNLPAAAHYYADSLIVGRGIAKDEQAAVAWYFKAAELGWLQSPRLLAAFYFDGKLVPRDMVEASKWLQVAVALMGPADAITRDVGNLVWPRLSEAERSEGAARARDYLETHKDAIRTAMQFQ